MLIFADGLTHGTPGQGGLLDVTLRIRGHEMLAVVGDAGSGVDTLARIIGGWQSPRRGRVLFDGTDVARADGRTRRRLRRKIQIVPPDPSTSLDPRRRIGAQIADGLHRRYGLGRSSRRAEIAALLELAGLPRAMAQSWPDDLDLGARQHVALARALSTNPDLLIVHASAATLDPSELAGVLALLDRLNRRLGLTLLIATNGLDMIRNVCDRIAVLSQGRVVEDGPTAQIISAPRDPHTAALLAASPIVGRQ